MGKWSSFSQVFFQHWWQFYCSCGFIQFMNNMLPRFLCLFVVSDPPLSSPQPEFQHEMQRYDGLKRTTFRGCLLLHRLLITGLEDVVLQRKDELSPSLLSHTCNFEENYSLPFEKVSMSNSLHLITNPPGDCLAPGSQVQFSLGDRSVCEIRRKSGRQRW